MAEPGQPPLADPLMKATVHSTPSSVAGDDAAADDEKATGTSQVLIKGLSRQLSVQQAPALSKLRLAAQESMRIAGFLEEAGTQEKPKGM